MQRGCNDFMANLVHCNSIWFGGVVVHQLQVLSGEVSFIFSNGTRHKQFQVRSLWTKPPIGFLKCNVDAALLFQAEGKIGSGIILRESDVNFVTAKSVINSYSSSSAPVAEAISIREALSW